MVAYRIQSILLKNAFHMLYHSMAWTYDWVAAIASAGKWETWIRTALLYINGPRVLELGFGPGHLQVDLNKEHKLAFGIDESRQMSSIASRNIREQARKPGDMIRLVRGKVQSLPFADETINTVVSTFPSPYIFDSQTINEIGRVLVPGGKIVIVLGAEITGKSPVEKMSAWLMSISHQSLDGQTEVQVPGFSSTFNSRIVNIDLQSSRVLLIEILKPG